jgi:hypothetical protein
MIQDRKAIQGLVVAGGIAVCIAFSRRLGATDFIRGDFNSDGKVTISDAYLITGFLFIGMTPSDCVLTGDVDDNGHLNLTDAVSLLYYLVENRSAPPAPFSSPGPDPTSNNDSVLGCSAYGGGTPIIDPSAKIEILDSVAEGGTNGEAVITVRISHSVVAAAYSGRILVDTSAIGAVIDKAEDLTGTLAPSGLHDAKVDNGKLSFGFLPSLIGKTGDVDPWLEPEQDKDALEITVCLRDGAAAGDYPMTLTAGEFADRDSGRAVETQLVSGTLTILADVAQGSGCESAAGCINDPFPPDQPLPEFNATFGLADAVARPGGTAEVSLTVHADADVQGYSISVDFDEEVLEALEVIPIFKIARGIDGFQSFVLNNKNDHPGSAGVDEGYLIGAMIFSFTDNCHNMPANRDNEAVRLKFLVNPATTAASTEVRFLDGGRGEGEPVRNNATAFFRGITPELASSFVFVNGVIGVQPDITTFVRGDSDGNNKVELNDAIHTLGYLFRGTEQPACFDAADANDDGRLNMADPISTLTVLFLGHGTVPPPYPNAGEDPTDDAMGCSTGP